jgi:hypothetical protein
MWCTMRRHSEALWCERANYKSHHRSFGDKLDDPENDPNEYFTVHPTYIRTWEFSSKKKIARNIGTHFRCKLWTKFRPQIGPINRYYILWYITDVKNSYVLGLQEFGLLMVGSRLVEAPWDAEGVPLSGYVIMSRVGPLALCYLFCPFGNQVVALSLV